MRCLAQHEPDARTARAFSGRGANQSPARNGEDDRACRTFERPQKASYFVGGYLQDEGYRIVPVNPKADTILGEKVYPDVASIPFPIDLIDIFRPPQDIDEIVTQAIARKEKGIDSPAIWMQLRLVNLPAAERALAAGLVVVIDKCVKMEHGRYHGGLHFAGMNTEIISARKRAR